MNRCTYRAVIAAALALGPGPAAFACSPQPLVGDVCTVAQNYCPQRTLPADGRLVSVKDYSTLFSLIGTTYGGDGTNTFALPDLRGRVLAGAGQGPGLAPGSAGDAFGAEFLQIAVANLPPHTHAASSKADVTAMLRGKDALANSPDPAGNVLATSAIVPLPPKGSSAPKTNTYGYSTQAANVSMDSSAISLQSGLVTTTIGSAGGGKPLPAAQPTLVLLQCIAFEGIYPQSGNP